MWTCDDIDDYGREERERNDLLERKAFGIDYYLSRGYRHEPSGSRLNETAWTCDDCKKLQIYPAMKYRAVVNDGYYHLGDFVCSNCKHNHSYNNDPTDKRGSVVYYHKEWELGFYEVIDPNTITAFQMVMPRLLRQIHEYPIYEDLKRVLSARGSLTKSSLCNPSVEYTLLKKTIENLRMNYVSELKVEEAVSVFANMVQSNRINPAQCYIPNSIYHNKRYDLLQNPVESLWDKFPFPNYYGNNKMSVKYLSNQTNYTRI